MNDITVFSYTKLKKLAAYSHYNCYKTLGVKLTYVPLIKLPAFWSGLSF